MPLYLVAGVTVHFPKVTKPMGQVMELNVWKDATAEVLRHAPCGYWEEGLVPKLDVDRGSEGKEDTK